MHESNDFVLEGSIETAHGHVRVSTIRSGVGANVKRTERSHGCCEKQRTMLHQAQQRHRPVLATNNYRPIDSYATLTLETTAGDDGTCAIVWAGVHIYLQSTFSSQASNTRPTVSVLYDAT